MSGLAFYPRGQSGVTAYGDGYCSNNLFLIIRDRTANVELARGLMWYHNPGRMLFGELPTADLYAPSDYFRVRLEPGREYGVYIVGWSIASAPGAGRVTAVQRPEVGEVRIG